MERTLLIFNPTSHHVRPIYRLLSMTKFFPANNLLLQPDQTVDRQPTIDNLVRIIKQLNSSIILVLMSQQPILQVVNTLLADYSITDPLMIISGPANQLQLNHTINYHVQPVKGIPRFKSNIFQYSHMDSHQISRSQLETNIYPYQFVESEAEDSEKEEEPVVNLIYQLITKEVKVPVQLDIPILQLTLTESSNEDDFIQVIYHLLADPEQSLRQFCNSLIVDANFKLNLETNYSVDLNEPLW